MMVRGLFNNMPGVFSGTWQNRPRDIIARWPEQPAGVFFTSSESLHRLTRGIAAHTPARVIVPVNVIDWSKHPTGELTKKSPHAPGSLKPSGL